MKDNPCAEVVSGHRLGQWRVERGYNHKVMAERFTVSAECWCGSTLGKSFFVSDELLVSYPSGDFLALVYMSIIYAAEDIIKDHSSLEYMDASMAEVKKVFSDIGYLSNKDYKPINFEKAIPHNQKHYETTVYDSDESKVLANASKKLPGVEYIVRCPSIRNDGVNCYLETSIYSIIQHLNDLHRWTREEIADWLEEIHDPTGENGPNINFEMEESQ